MRTLTAAALAEGLTAFAEPAQLKRWAGSLGDLARSGHLGSALVLEALHRTAPALARDRRGLADLLGLLLDTSIETPTSVPEQTRRWLESFEGSSQAARHARRLLTL